jgi:hypothetical protein
VDNWSVRRGLSTSNLAQSPLSMPERRLRESEAMMMQFHEQLQSIRLQRLLASQFVEARRYFRYLPPMGMIPLANNRHPIGFDASAFFRGITVADSYFIEGERLRFISSLAREFAAVDLNATLPGTSEPESNVVLRIYTVRENQQDAAQQPYIVFTTGHMPDVSLPYYDVNRWNYANPR